MYAPSHWYEKHLKDNNNNNYYNNKNNNNKFDHTNKWYMHHPAPVLETDT